MMRRLITSMLLALAPASSAVELETVLIPINAQGVHGANGSVWVSSFSITNFGNEGVPVFGIEPCFLNTVCDPTIIGGKSTVFTGIYDSLMTFDASVLDRLSLHLRVQDVSRQSQTWGSSIPVVSEKDAFTSANLLNLTDIPTGDTFRSMLRIYDFDPIGFDPPREVRVRFYAIDPAGFPGPGGDPLLLETTYPLEAHPIGPFTEAPMATIPLWTIAELTDVGRIRIEVEAQTPDLRFWAFVSATNNETQHVTIISP